MVSKIYKTFTWFVRIGARSRDFAIFLAEKEILFLNNSLNISNIIY